MSFRDRLSGAIERERRLIEWLRMRGYTAEPFGQALLTAEMRTALLHVIPATIIRWMPDVIAVRGNTVFLLDAKGEQAKTENCAIEDASSQCGIALTHAFGLPIIHVWPGGLAITADEEAHVMKRKGPQSSRGSGTPYHLIPKKELEKLETVLQKCWSRR